MEDNECSPTQSDGDTVVVITTPTNFHNPQIFTPTNYEDLSISPQEPLPETPSPTSSYSSSSTPHPPEVRNTLLNTSVRILSSWVLRIAWVRDRIGFWSVASAATVFVTVTAYAMRWQRWRRIAEKDNMDRLLVLINQKDEKIKQLLVQIDRMNETLSARRRVPVFRVVVDSPFVIGPRSTWKLT